MPRGVYPRPPRRERKTVIRVLKAGEPLPDGEPRRFLDRDGYIRLRWRVGPYELVEIREHRAINEPRSDDHVHHRNHNPSDNRPENLVTLTASEHTALHARERRRWDRERAAHLYDAGLSTTDIAIIYGVNSATVSRGLRAIGVSMRAFANADRTEVDEQTVLRLHDAGVRAKPIGDQLGVGREVIVRVLREHGRK